MFWRTIGLAWSTDDNRIVGHILATPTLKFSTTGNRMPHGARQDTPFAQKTGTDTSIEYEQPHAKRFQIRQDTLR